MTDPPYMTAPAADGPKLVAWANKTLDMKRLPHMDESLSRRCSDWRRGGRATTHLVDRLVTLYGFHLADLPDDLWLESINPHHAPARPKPAPRPTPLFVVRCCHNCGREMSRARGSDGRSEGPARYAKRKFCSRSCGHEAAAGKGKARSPEFNSRLLSEKVSELFEQATEDAPARGEKVA